ncbi:MAG TPA: PAS domain-containing protein, partial [Candidatus Acidoferrum sp.]|nr:PAS domain-containing protein [Candidatus Acidoferrum sp.]
MATLVMLDSRDLEIARLRAALARANQGQKGEAEARKRDEELQFASDFYGRTVIDNIPGFVVILATGGILEACNRPVLEYAGLTFEELREWKSTGFVHPDDLPRIVEHLSGTIVAGVPYEHELRLRRFDGDFRWFSSRGVPIQDGADNVVRRYCALLIDIEDRKRAETELRFAFAHLSEAQRLSKTGSFIADMADQRSWSDEAYRIFEFEPGTKVTLDRIRDTVHPEDRAMIDRVFERAAPGIDADFLFRIVTASGVVKHVHGAAHVLEKVGARPSLVGALQDVTESKLAEQALKQSEANLQRTLAQLSEAQRLSKTGSYTNNLAKEEFVWSDELYRIFDFEPGSKITVQRVRECVYPEDLQSFQTAVDWARQGLITDPIFRIFSTNGVVKHLRTIKKIEPKTDGSFEVTGAIQDITESKLTEQALETKAEELRRALTHLSEAQRLSKTGSFTADLMRDEHYWSEELYRICGFELGSKITIQRFEDIVHPDDQAALRTTIERGLNDADSVDILVRLITPEGLKHVHL